MLPNASVVLIRSADSVMETYTRSDQNGGFQLHTDSEGKYLIMISFPGFADYIDEIKVDKKLTDVGKIPMLTKMQLLKEVIITKERAAIKIKGDTVEYVADSFKTRDNATVEELLKKLPGLEVDKNGQITAQGEKVQKILVDGEEFFSDDPAMVTKSLQANIVDKVQVFNKKSDQAEFTGIDDGQKIKTINLELKEKVKKGYLGKLEGGGGSDGFFQNDGMISAFRNKSQFAAFGIVSSTNQVGLNWGDKDKFNLNSANTTIDDEGESITYYSNGDNGFDSWNGEYNGQGLPKVWTGGVHFSQKWNKDIDHLQSDYRFARQNVELTGNVLTQFVLPDSQYYTKQSTNQFSTTDRHGYSGYFEWKPDTTLSIKLSADAGYRTSQINSQYNDQTLTPGGDLINSNARTITTNTTDQYVNTGLLIRKKLAKKGRTISAEFKENYDLSTSNGDLNSVNTFYLQPDSNHTIAWDSLYNINQKKQLNTNMLAFSGKLTYTEPISKVCHLIINYAASIHNNSSKNYSYDRSPATGAFDSLDALYSSNYVYNVMNNSGGADLRFKYDNVNFSFGSDVAGTQFTQIDQLHGDTSYRHTYFNIFPRASVSWQITKQKWIDLSYSGRTQQPTIQQIQPLRQNTDPLNIAIGNPGLKQQFNNNFNIYYNSYKMLEHRNLWIGGGFNFIKDAISQSISTTEFGRTYQYVNTDGNYNGWIYGDYGFLIKKLDLHIGINANSNINHNTQFVNGIQNISDNISYGGGISIRYDKTDKYSFSIHPGITYNDNHATISTYATSYWISSNEFSASVDLPWKLEIGTSVDWELRQQTVVFDKNNNVLRWDAYISKKFLKSKQLELRLYVYDILNQNIGYTRMAQENFVQENTYNTISRYGILGFVWNFSKTGTGQVKETK